jgi:hypothetical protein
MQAIYKAVCNKGRFLFFNNFDVEKYCIENDGIEVDLSIKHSAKTPEKMRMYNFLHGPLMDSAMRGYTRQGWTAVDKVKARYMLQAELAKEEMYNSKTGEIQVYLIDLSSMSKARLLKFIQDCMFYIEQELETEVPDSEEWKAKQLSGRNYKQVK